jgi:hypothetical protein
LWLTFPLTDDADVLVMLELPFVNSISVKAKTLTDFQGRYLELSPVLVDIAWGLPPAMREIRHVQV